MMKVVREQETSNRIKRRDTADRIVQGLMHSYLAESTADQVLQSDIADFLSESWATMAQDGMTIVTEELMAVGHSYTEGGDAMPKVDEFLSEIKTEYGLVVSDQKISEIKNLISIRISHLLASTITKVHARLADDRKIKEMFSKIIEMF